MSSEYTCDGCGKNAPAFAGPRGWEKPPVWYQRHVREGETLLRILDVCSRPCMAEAEKRTGSDKGLVFPV